MKKIQRAFLFYTLDEASRNKVLSEFEPKYEDVIAHHITVKRGVPITDPLPEIPHTRIVGYANDPSGIEALVVEVNGTTVREDYGTYHITLSLDRSKFKPVDSNELLKKGWQKLAKPININTLPEYGR